MNSIESLQNRGKGAAVTRKHGYKINTASIEAQHAAEEMMLQIENDMKNASAKLAAEQAERMVKDSIAASMERIKNENESMRTWEENMVRRSGYHVDGKNIYRDAVVDSTIGKTYYEGQSVHYYEDFYNAGPTISVSLSKTMLDGLNSSAIMLLVEQANYDIENWSKQVFGNTEKDEDGNVVLKQNAVAREASYDDDIERYKALSKKDYDKLSEDEQKEFNKLSTGIVSVRDGLLGEWTGYAPVFKDGNSGLDLSNSRESNIKYQGDGQMGQIMLDFQWNSMIEQQGWQKVALPAYDQPLWRGNGSWFEPPTIRGVASIVFEIVGQASSQTWFSYADDVIFAAIDLGGGFKSAEQVGLDLAKTAATAVISMGCSSAGSAVGKVADASLKGAGKVLAKAGISAATSYATSVGTSFVNNWNFDKNGNLAFDSESFGKSTYSAQTIAGSVGAGVTAGLTTAANMKMQKMGDNGAAVNKFYGTAINAGISAAGKLSEYAVYSAYALAEGRTLADAYDDMGGLTFNIGSLGMFADMMASGIARNNATGQAGKFGEIAQKLEGKGILEINIGSNGIKGKFGMGGFDLAGSLYTFGKRMSDKASLKAYAMQEGVSKDEAEAAYLGYVYGDWTQENTMARISSRRDELHIVDKMADGANAQTVQKADGSGRIITMKNTGDYHTNAVTLGHESYRDGIVSNKADQQRETFNAVLGHTGMAERMTQYGNSFSGLLAAEIEAYQRGDMNALMMDSLYNYDSSADYWKLMDDGSIAYDGRADLYDENDNLIYQTKKRGLEGSFIEILYGENATAEQKKAAIDLLEKNFSHYTKGGDKDNRDNWYWDTKDNEGKSMSVDQYEDIYKTRVLKDSVTGVEATIEQHNPVNIYKKMVANGTMDLRPGIENAPEDFVKAMGNGKYITYDQFKKNNYITGGIPDYTINTPVPDGSVISTLFGAGGTSAAGSYRIHAGIDFAVVSGIKVYPMLVNDDTFVIAAHNEDSYKDTIQGKYVLLGSNFSYNYKGVNIDELITQSYDHLTSTTLKVDDTINANTLLGLSGNTGKWGTKTYGAHLHTDIYTNLKSSPLLNYINMNYKNNIAKNLMHQSSLNNSPSRYYDPLALLQNYTYKIRQDAWTY